MRSSARRQRGQSLVEMAIALVVLVPLAWGVVLLGQYMHIRHVTQAAARQAAWAATVDPALAKAGLPDKAAVQRKLRASRFGGADADIQSDRPAPAHFQNPMLITLASRALLQPDDLTLTAYGQQGSPSYIDKVVSKLGDVISRIPVLHMDSFPPNRQGLVVAEVHANTRKVVGANGETLSFLGPLATQRLDFSARTVVLADPWNASGPGETLHGEFDKHASYSNRTVRAVIRPMVPTEWFPTGSKVVNSVVNVLGKIPVVKRFLTNNMDYSELGRAAPDVVPHDKLVDYKDVH